MAWNRVPNQTGVISGGPPRLAICTPHEVKVTEYWALRMQGPLLFSPTNWCEKVHQLARGAPISIDRDTLVEGALADPKVTHILWVDTDSICENPEDPNLAAQMLFQCNQPIVSGLYRAKQAEGFNYAMWYEAVDSTGKRGFAPISSFTGNWLQVATIGLGFCLVKREVYEKIQKPWHPWVSKDGPSEDFAFCIKARAAGYSINVFTDVKIGHIGDLIVHSDGTVGVLKV